MHAYVRVQNFNTKVYKLFSTVAELLDISNSFDLLWEFTDAILPRITCWKRGLSVKQKSLT